MSSPYIGEIRMFSGNFAPAGWAFCDGALMAISENDTLFNLIGTTYGGDGQETFALPNLQSRIPMHMGSNGGQSYVLAEAFGEESVTLTVSQIPAHSHIPQASQAGNRAQPTGNVWAGSALNQFSTAAPTTTLDPAAISSTGGTQPHDNMSPFLVVNFIISLFGIYPSQT